VAMTAAHYDGTLDALTATSEGVESDLQAKKRSSRRAAPDGARTRSRRAGARAHSILTASPCVEVAKRRFVVRAAPIDPRSVRLQLLSSSWIGPPPLR
jgi:hypothetical protein